MNNLDNIEKVLKELNIIYNKDESFENDIKRELYLIKFVTNNVIILGGVIDDSNTDEKAISIMFFFEKPKNLNSDKKIFLYLNKINRSCKFGNFTFDEKVSEINYNLSIPILHNNTISEKTFKFYLQNVISLLRKITEELFIES